MNPNDNDGASCSAWLIDVSPERRRRKWDLVAAAGQDMEGRAGWLTLMVVRDRAA